MLQITRSTTAMALAAAAGVGLVIDRVLTAVAFAVLNPQGDFSIANNLATAGDWLGAVAGAAALAAVGSVVWPMVIQKRWTDVWEVSAAVVATLLLAVGLLVNAADSPGGSDAADVLAAVGIGGWAVLVITCAGRRSLQEQADTGLDHQAGLWLLAGVGLVLLAVGFGLPVASIEDKGLAVATGAVQMLGVATLAVSLELAHRRGFLGTRRRDLAAGLWTLAAAYGTQAVVAGVVFGPMPSITAVRIGVSITELIEAAGFALLALAAWNRVRELVVPRLEDAPPMAEEATTVQDDQRVWAPPRAPGSEMAG